MEPHATRFREVDTAEWGLAVEPHYVRSRAFVSWVAPPRHVGVFAYRPQRPSDIEECFAVAELLTRFPEPVSYFADARLFTTEGPAEPTIRTLLFHLATAYPRLARTVRRQGLVSRADWMGVFWAGAVNVIGPFVSARASQDAAATWDWLEAPAGLPEAVDALTRDFVREGGAVRDVVALLGERPALDLAGVARELGRSARSLQRDLTSAGESFQELRARVRLRIAEAWLEAPDVKLEAVADAVGFRSVTHFTAWFRERTGLSPAQWRRTRPVP